MTKKKKDTSGTTTSSIKFSKEELYLRQTGIAEPAKLAKNKVTVIGAGSVGSFTVLALAKMGVEHMDVWEPDTIETHNLPSQFFKHEQVGQSKLSSIENIVGEFGTHQTINPVNKFYTGQKLKKTDVIITTTDNMQSRKKAYEEACRQGAWLIDARMGAELGIIYRINTKIEADRKLYEKTLFSDDDAEDLPCTARTIIYNVMVLAGLICKAYKTIATEEDFPQEAIFNMTRIDKLSFMIRKE